MSAPPTAAEHRRASLLLAAATLSLMAGAALALFSTFMFYDDEGYILLSLRNFAEHGGLYRDVYTQYGPLPYVLHYAAWLAGYPLTHVGGRFLTLLFWGTSALLCAQLVWRSTRHLALALATLCAAVLYLWVMVREPNHPGALAAALLALAAYGGFRALESGRTAALAAMGGALVAALLLTKINLGVFAACSVVALLGLYGAAEPVRRFSPWLFVAAGMLLPLALMRTLIAQPWVQTYAATFAVMAAGLMLAGGEAARQPGAARFGRRELGAVLLGGIAVSVPVIGVVVMRGTSLADILEGVLLGPLRHPAVFSVVLSWPTGVFGSIALGGAAALWAYALRRGSHRPAVDCAVAAGRLLLAGGLLLASLEIFGLAQRGFVFNWCGPWLWLCLWPLPGESSRSQLAGRTWLGLLLLGQWLHAYPVPGSQVGWGSFLALPLVAMSAPSAVAYLAGSVRSPRMLSVGRKLAIAGLVAFSSMIGFIVAQLGSVYWGSRPLGLPGVEHIRIPDATTAAYRILSFNAAAHADVLFTFPGMCSFNLWTSLPTPTLANTTHWFSLLDDARQRKIIQALEAHPRAALIVQTQHLAYLREKGFAPKGLLFDYLEANFSPVFRIDDFEFHLKRSRVAAPFFTAELLQRAGQAAEPGIPAAALRIPLALPPGTVIDRIEIARMDDRGLPPGSFGGAGTRMELAPINLAGTPQGKPVNARFPLRLQEPALLSLYFDTPPAPLSLRHTLLVLRAPDGAELALVRLRP